MSMHTVGPEFVHELSEGERVMLLEDGTCLISHPERQPYILTFDEDGQAVKTRLAS
jgi:hypothetical protein